METEHTFGQCIEFEENLNFIVARIKMGDSEGIHLEFLNEDPPHYK